MKNIKHILKYVLSSVFFMALFSSSSSAAGCGVGGESDFNKFICSGGTGGAERTFVGVSIPYSVMGCTYGKDGGHSEDLYHSVSCSSEYWAPVVIPEDSATGIVRSGTNVDSALIAKTTEIATLFAAKNVTYNEIAWTSLVQTDSMYTSLSDVYRKISAIQNPQAGTGHKSPWETTFDQALSSAKINSHDNYKDTLSAIVTAAFTVDPDFFVEGYLNDLGELQPKTVDVAMKFGTGDDDWAIWTWIKEATGFDTGKSTFVVDNPLDFMDKQVLGYYVHTVELLRSAYNEIVFMFFIIGGAYSFGFYSYKKGLEKYGKEPFNMNKMTFMSSTLTAFLFFSAPAINDGELKNVTELRDEERQEVENWSSLGQETVRYVAQSSNYFANLTSDYVMQSYLTMVGKKSGFLELTTDDVRRIGAELGKIEKDKRILLAQMNLYTGTCRKYFKLNANEFFDGTPEEQTANNKVVDEDSFEALNNANIGADRLAYRMCSTLEMNVLDTLNETALAITVLKKEITSYADLMNSGGESLKRLKSFVEIMAFGQTNFGWIFSSSIPVSYFFFDNANIFLYDRVNSPGENTDIISNKLNNRALEVVDNAKHDKGVLEAAGEFAEDAAIGLGSTYFVQQSYFFVLPFFDKLYNAINGMGQSVVLGTQRAMSGGNGVAIDKAQKKATGFFSTLSSAAKVLGKNKGKGSVMSRLLNSKTGSIAFSAFIAMFSLWIASMIYTYLISAVTIVTVSALLVLKITLYYIELMLFFLTVPAKGLYYVLMGGSSGKNYLAMYTQSLAGLFMTPLLIVLVTAILIPAGKFFQSFFQALMGMLQVVISEGSDMIKATTNHAETLGDKGAIGVIDATTISIHKILVVTGMEGLSTIFAHFAFLILSFILVINFQGWFMKMVGMEGGVDSFKDTSGEMRQGSGGKALNPVG